MKLSPSTTEILALSPPSPTRPEQDPQTRLCPQRFHRPLPRPSPRLHARATPCPAPSPSHPRPGLSRRSPALETSRCDHPVRWPVSQRHQHHHSCIACIERDPGRGSSRSGTPGYRRLAAYLYSVRGGRLIPRPVLLEHLISLKSGSSRRCSFFPQPARNPSTTIASSKCILNHNSRVFR